MKKRFFLIPVRKGTIVFSIFLAVLMPVISFSQVVFYTDCYYRGQSVSLGPGNYYNSTYFKLPDRSISSISVPPGYRVEIFASQNMTGSVGTATTSQVCLSSLWNNKTRSIRITYLNGNPDPNINQSGGVSVYTDCSYNGRYAFLTPGDYPRLSTIIGNDAISSLRVPEGMVIELYRDERFMGCVSGKITSDDECLGSFWNNTASSAKVFYKTSGYVPPVPPPTGSYGDVIFYEACNYIGQSQRFNVGDFRDLRTALANRPAGSIMIPAGLTVELYSEMNFGGYLLAKYTSNMSCLQSNLQFGARSMRIYGTGGGGYVPGYSNGVTIYESCGLAGRSSVLTVGNYYNLSTSGNFSPASLRVPPGYEITLYLELNMQGTSSGKITQDVNCLGDWLKLRARSATVSRIN